MTDYYSIFVREMKNRNYSRNTIRVYSMHIKHFLEFCRQTKHDPRSRISVFLESKIKTSESRRLAWSSIKLFYELVLQKECPYKLDRVRNRKRLPDILSHSEVILLLNSISNKKHKLIISFLYGSGLRVSEVTNLKIKDLDLINQKIRITNSKQNKDRLSLFSGKSSADLKALILNRSASDYIFVTQMNKKYSIRTVQKIFSTALAKSGLQKKSTCHTLRHCFATHLVESGVDIKTIKELLGHSSIKTTMIYINLADPISRKIKSPL